VYDGVALLVSQLKEVGAYRLLDAQVDGGDRLEPLVFFEFARWFAFHTHGQA
jgi:hypothetical protein